MSELFLMAAIINRQHTREFADFYEENGVSVNLITLGKGTARSEVLDYFGLEDTEKSVIFSVVTGETWKVIKRGLQKKMHIDVPGTGIAFVVPMSSIGGKRQLQFLTGNQEFQKGEESALKDTKYELLVVIANQGYTELIMDAARKSNAAGGTVIHAKGTGMEGAERFLGVTLAAEKEMLFIVTKKEQRNAIMKSIMDEAGMNSKAKSIVFSLPVTSTAGMRLMEEAEND
ncbi:MAG: P-II family nitrogen regulator [Lachnospiraceae bacterium]|nr:P-II family nitrogen regulator [Lachnospiraceae bacterium]